MMTSQRKEVLLKKLTVEALANKYQSYIKYLIDDIQAGSDADAETYNVFKTSSLETDVQALAYCLINKYMSFDEYWQRLELLIGWDLMILGIVEGNITEFNEDIYE